MLPYGKTESKPFANWLWRERDAIASLPPMERIGLPRLRALREAAGGLTQEGLAADVGVSISQISRYESGKRDPTLAHLRAIAGRLGLTVGELIGEAPRAALLIPIKGLIGAGQAVEQIGDPEEVALPAAVEIAADRPVEGYVVRGDSQRPRFLDGEVVLYDPRSVAPGELVGRTAIVQTVDGRRLIKTLRRGIGADRWRLDSHNADPEENVELIGAWRYLGLLPATEETRRPQPAPPAPAPGRPRPGRKV